jgi:hypothetical protein
VTASEVSGDWEVGPGERDLSYSSASWDIHRGSVEGDRYYIRAYNGDIVYMGSMSPTLWKAAGLTTYTNIAAVASDGLYVLRFYDGSVASDYSEIELSYHTTSTVSTCPYRIQVDEDYVFDDSWLFDAVRLSDGTDVIVYNSNSHGHPKIILRRNNVWGDPRAMIPEDLVDNYTYLKIGYMKLYEDTIYASGELGRAGSTGLHPQSMGVILRSRDGVHWTFDRFRYMGTTPNKSPLLIDNGYAYKVVANAGDNYATVSKAPLTPVFDLDDNDITSDHINIDIDDDILGWGYTQTQGDGRMSLSLSNYDLAYSDPSSSTYIKPGYMIKLYAGYRDTTDDHEVLIGTFGVDGVPTSFAAGTNSITVSCREWTSKLLGDYYFDQDWHWLSQDKHFDPCETPKALYGIGGEYTRLESVNDESIYEWYGGQHLYSESEQRLMAYAANHRNLFVSTSPYEARNAHIDVTFSLVSELGANQPGMYEIGKSFDSDYQVFGNGCGVAFIEDAYNFLTAFLYVMSEELYLVRVTGNKDEETWEVLDTMGSISSYITEGDNYVYEVYMNMVETELIYGLRLFYVGLAGQQAPTTIESELTVTRLGEYRVGVLTSGYVPNIQVIAKDMYASEPSKWMARSLADYGDGALPTTGGYYRERAYVGFGYPEGDGNRTSWEEFCTLSGTNDILVGKDQFRMGSPASDYQSVRGDFISGIWTITAYASDASDNWHITLNDSCWPPGDTATWWGTGANSYGFCAHFVNGDLDGSFSKILSCTRNGTNDNEFVLIPCSTYAIPAVGDNVVVGPGFGTLYGPMYSHQRGATAYRYGWGGHGVRLYAFQAFDLERDKSVDWLLKDIASKAGLLKFQGSMASVSLDTGYVQEHTNIAEATWNWLDDKYGDFELLIELNGSNMWEDELSNVYVVLGSDAKSYLDTPQMFILIQTTGTDGESNRVWFYYRNTDTTSSTYSVMKSTESHYRGGKNITVSKQKNFVSVWMEDKFIGGCAYRGATGTDDDEYDSTLEDSGYVGTYVTYPNAVITYDVRIRELHNIIDGIYVNQGAKPQSGFTAVIRDARVKMIPTSTGALKISKFETRDNLGTFPDLILTDSTNIKDNIPTHVRVTGAEISEFMDHANMAEYGVLFHSRRAPSLYEESAYREASKMVNDAISYTTQRQIRSGAQLQMEVEDRLQVSYTSLEGLVVSEDCVIHAITIDFGEAGLEAVMDVRKYFEDN